MSEDWTEIETYCCCDLPSTADLKKKRGRQMCLQSQINLMMLKMFQFLKCLKVDVSGILSSLPGEHQHVSMRLHRLEKFLFWEMNLYLFLCLGLCIWY